MPFCDTPAMQAHLGEISATVASDAHAVLILDQAGWHLARALVVPNNITILPLPPRSPELNPVERQLALEPGFKGYDDIVAHCCSAWNDLISQPWRIRSIGRRDWAEGF
jgi:transposase